MRECRVSIQEYRTHRTRLGCGLADCRRSSVGPVAVFLPDTLLEVSRGELVRAELEVAIVRLAVVDDDPRRRRHQLMKGGPRFGAPTVFSVTTFGMIFLPKMSLENSSKFEIWF